MASSNSNPVPTTAHTSAPSAGSSWVDSFCVGPCAEFFQSQPALHRWRGVIFQYLILSAIVVLVLIYQAITRRIATGPEAPPAPKRQVTREKPNSPKKEPTAAAPKSPKAKPAKKVAVVAEKADPEPVASPKARKPRKSVSPTTTKAPAETVADVPAYVIVCDYECAHRVVAIADHLLNVSSPARRRSLAPKSPKGKSKVEAPTTTIAESRYVPFHP